MRREGQRLLLHFGAVDQEAKIYVNGKLAGAHLGGYTAFTVELTEFLTDGPSVLTVAVRDGTDTNEYCRGKQKHEARRHLVHAAERHLADGLDGVGAAELYHRAAHHAGRGERLRARRGAGRGKPRVLSPLCGAARRRVHEPRMAFCAWRPRELWTPEHPKLYEFSAELGEDRVESYFALRDYRRRARRERRHPCLTLNGKPVFHTGVLDQGYWPDGLYTAPSDEALSLGHPGR